VQVGSGRGRRGKDSLAAKCPSFLITIKSTDIGLKNKQNKTNKQKKDEGDAAQTHSPSLKDFHCKSPKL
jgi:hypothetical protein